MSAELISTEDWQMARFVDWATRFLVPLVLALPEKDRERLLQKMERDFAHANGQTAGKT